MVKEGKEESNPPTRDARDSCCSFDAVAAVACESSFCGDGCSGPVSTPGVGTPGHGEGVPVCTEWKRRRARKRIRADKNSVWLTGERVRYG